jgi:hypothetical protein
MQRLRSYITHPISIAPLATFRAMFGVVMLAGVIRFMLNGWVTELYVKPRFFFSYYGFDWVKPLGEAGMYVVFVTMALAAVCIGFGAFYRIAAPVFFLTWTYVELLDVTNYLNHYYFVSIAAFLLALLPAHRSFSWDVWQNPALRMEKIPRWMVGAVRLQLGIVYFFAGIAKINGDWLLRAQPLKIWLASKTHLPLIGWAFKYGWIAHAFSWAGCIYDLTVPFLLLVRKARPYAYAAVVGFHLMTWWLFPIGIFPFVMIFGTLVFFPAEWHEKWQERIARILAGAFGVPETLKGRSESLPQIGIRPRVVRMSRKILFGMLAIHFVLQVAVPLRYLLYGDNLFWHEQGFRFSWRVMLMEKTGYAIFHIRDPKTGRKTEIRNEDYLERNQVRMMSTQPDLILQFAHFLASEYKKKGIANPEVYAETYAALNGSGSRPFTDPRVDLAKETENFAAKTWILPFEQKFPEISDGAEP